MPVHPLEERKLPPNANTSFGASRSATGRPAECDGGHCGVDLYYWKGEKDRNIGIGRPVFAVAAGQVIAASASSSAGKFVWIKHDNFRSHYIHLNSYSVNVGDTVAEGQQIGTLGRTGITTDPAHLHFGLSTLAGKYYDPVPDLGVWPLVGGGIGVGVLVAAAALYWYWKR